MRAESANPFPIGERSDAARGRRIVFASLAILMALHLLHPGDSAFINDEPNLIGKALAANHRGRLAPHGLLGSLGVAYSPVCVWFYQLLLAFTSNLLTLTLIKTAVVWIGVWLALWCITQHVHLSPWPLLLIPLAPLHAFFQRLLWDNVFLIPISAAMVATLVGFLTRPNAWRLAGLAALAVLAFHVHLLAAVPIAACVLTVLVFRFDWVRAHKLVSAAVSIAALGACARFLYSIVAERVQSYHPHPEFAQSLGGAAHGFWIWSHAGFAAHMSSFYRDLPGADLWVSGTGWMALGAGLAALAGFLFWMTRHAPKRREWATADVLAFLSAAMVLGQLVLLVVLKLEPFGHYFNGVWFGYFYLLWWGYDRVSRRAWARALLATQIIAVAAMTLLLARFVHAHHGDRTQFHGATLGNQMDVARMLVERRPESVSFEVENYTLYPHALQVLIQLEAARTGAPIRPGRGRAIVKYADPAGDDGSIAVEFSDGADAKR